MLPVNPEAIGLFGLFATVICFGLAASAAVMVGKEIGDDALFTVGLQNYHFKNIESFFNISYEAICKLQKPRSVATSCQDILMEYFREHEMLDAAVDGRMTILAPDGTAR